ncbi:MAG: alanine/glycine:cation symporter family protein [Ostreibacterium sp.]
MESAISSILGIIWSPALIFLCLAAGLMYSILTRFAQVRHFFEMWRLLFKGVPSEHGISSFQALAVSLSGRVGIGNIAGVAAAIGFGGPGAIFWMWVVAFLGASTAYVESTLGQIYKERGQLTGQYRGGPAYYFEKCLGQKWYAVVFSISAIMACGFFLPGVQANGVVNAVTQVLGEGTIVNTGLFGEIGMNRIIGLVVILLVLGFIIFGGIKRIANFTQIIVPFMALGYIIMAVIIIIADIQMVPELFKTIVNDAFTPQAGLGAAIFWGVKRGIYSNEAGQGTGPHAAAAAEVEHPAQQGLVQAFSVYVDTIFVCSATAFMILITQQYNVQGALPDGQFIVQHIDAATNISSPAFTQLAVSSVFGSFGSFFVAVAVFFFAFTTILAYYYITEVNTVYLARAHKNLRGPVLFLIKVCIMVMVAFGALNSSGYIWNLGDVGVGLMAWLNIMGIIFILFMGRPALKALKDYEVQKKAGVKHYTFDPRRLGIKNATFWEERTDEQNKK